MGRRVEHGDRGGEVGRHRAVCVQRVGEAGQPRGRHVPVRHLHSLARSWQRHRRQHLLPQPGTEKMRSGVVAVYWIERHLMTSSWCVGWSMWSLKGLAMCCCRCTCTCPQRTTPRMTQCAPSSRIAPTASTATAPESSWTLVRPPNFFFLPCNP